MDKVTVVYWSQSGNTQAMAEAVGEGIKEAGKEAEVISVDAASVDSLKEDTVFALGCPAMGAEVLEEAEMEPFVTEIEAFVSGKKIGLFGSYGWGDGQWMRDWAQRAQDDGAQLFSEEGLICNETPDDDVQAACRKLGADLAAW